MMPMAGVEDMDEDMEDMDEDGDGDDDSDDMVAVDKVRSNFPETWLWTEIVTGYIRSLTLF